MPAPTPCPNRQDLERFAAGRLAEDSAGPIEEHLRGCPHCVAALDAVADDDALLRALRADGSTSAAEATAVEGLIGRLKQLPAVPGTCAGDATLPPSPPAEDPAPPAPADVCGVLAPPQRPGELGRLGPYRVLKMLGAGGMGVVFQAEDVALQRLVALKVMNPALGASATGRERFLLEARAAAAIEHDHIVAIHQVGEDRGVPFIAMPFLKGEALDVRLQREGRLALSEVLRIGAEIAEGLAAAHEHGLIHRDIKPGNVWLEAPRGRVKILDFGLVRAGRGESGLTAPGALLGTPEYMPPEQTRGQAVDHRGDLFSLGVVLYALATGELPFRGDDPVVTIMAVATEQPRPPRDLRPELPPALSDLIVRLLAKEPDQRLPSAQATADALRAIARGPAEATVAMTPPPGPARPGLPAGGRRRPWRPVLAVGLLMVLLGMTGLAGRLALRWGLRDEGPGPAAGAPGAAIQQVTTPGPGGSGNPVPADGPDFDEVHDADTARFADWIDKMEGLRATAVSLYTVAGRTRFAAVAVREENPNVGWWALRHGNWGDFATKFREFSNDSYRLIASSAALGGDGPHYVSLWVRDGVGPWYNESLAETAYRNVLAESRDKGRRPVSVSVYRDEGELSYQTTTAPAGGLDWKEWHGLTDDDLTRLYKEYEPGGWRPDFIDAYPDQGGTRFLVILVKGAQTPRWEARHGLSSAQYQEAVTAFKAQHLRPLSVAGYEDNGESRFAAIWIQYTPPAK